MDNCYHQHIHHTGTTVNQKSFIKESKTPIVIYDGECPFCSAYVKMYRLKASLGELKLINARDLTADEREAVKDYDLDKGMIFAINGRVYHGSDAVNALALMSSKVGVFNKLNAAIFRSQTASTLLYPVLRLGRATALKAKGADWITGAKNP
jgi:hypothetical protein